MSLDHFLDDRVELQLTNGKKAREIFRCLHDGCTFFLGATQITAILKKLLARCLHFSIFGQSRQSKVNPQNVVLFCEKLIKFK